MKSWVLKSWTLMLALAAGLGMALNLGAAGVKGVAYVSDQEEGVVAIDLASLQPAGTIDMGKKAPRGIGVTADGKHVITANRDGADVSVIDTATMKIIKDIPIGKNPEFVRVRGDRAYVTFEPSSKAGPPGQQAAKANDDDEGPKEPAQIAIIDLNEWKVVGTITGGPETEGIEFSPDGKLMLVTNEADNTITAHELPSGRLVKTIDTTKIGERPRGIKVSPNGAHYVVSLEYADKFLVLDRDLTPVKAVATAKTPYGVAFDREGKRLFVAASGGKKLQVFDAKNFTPIKDIPVGERCWHFTFTPDDRKILVACGRSHEVLVFDAKTYALIKRLQDRKLPWGIVTYPKSAGSLDMP